VLAEGSLGGIGRQVAARGVGEELTEVLDVGTEVGDRGVLGSHVIGGEANGVVDEEADVGFPLGAERLGRIGAVHAVDGGDEIIGVALQRSGCSDELRVLEVTGIQALSGRLDGEGRVLAEEPGQRDAQIGGGRRKLGGRGKGAGAGDRDERRRGNARDHGAKGFHD
jgi:hypothetical protein